MSRGGGGAVGKGAATGDGAGTCARSSGKYPRSLPRGLFVDAATISTPRNAGCGTISLVRLVGPDASVLSTPGGRRDDCFSEEKFVFRAKSETARAGVEVLCTVAAVLSTPPISDPERGMAGSWLGNPAGTSRRGEDATLGTKNCRTSSGVTVWRSLEGSIRNTESLIQGTTDFETARLAISYPGWRRPILSVGRIRPGSQGRCISEDDPSNEGDPDSSCGTARAGVGTGPGDTSFNPGRPDAGSGSCCCPKSTGAAPFDAAARSSFVNAGVRWGSATPVDPRVAHEAACVGIVRLDAALGESGDTARRGVSGRLCVCFLGKGSSRTAFVAGDSSDGVRARSRSISRRGHPAKVCPRCANRPCQASRPVPPRLRKALRRRMLEERDRKDRSAGGRHAWRW